MWLSVMLQSFLSCCLELFYTARLYFFALFFHIACGRYASFDTGSQIITLDVDTVNSKFGGLPHVSMNLKQTTSSLCEDMQRESALFSGGMQTRFGILRVKAASAHCPENCFSWRGGHVILDNCRVELELTQTPKFSSDRCEVVRDPLEKPGENALSSSTAFSDFFMSASALPGEDDHLEIMMVHQLQNFLQKFVVLPFALSIHHVSVTLTYISLNSEKFLPLRLEVECNKVSVNRKMESAEDASTEYSVELAPIKCRVLFVATPGSVFHSGHPATRDTVMNDSLPLNKKIATIYLDSPPEQTIKLLALDHNDVGTLDWIYPNKIHLTAQFEEAFFDKLSGEPIHVSSSRDTSMHLSGMTLELILSDLSWRRAPNIHSETNSYSSVEWKEIIIENKYFGKRESDGIDTGGTSDQISHMLSSFSVQLVETSISFNKCDLHDCGTYERTRPRERAGPCWNVHISSLPMTILCCDDTLDTLASLTRPLLGAVTEWCDHLTLSSSRDIHVTCFIHAIPIKLYCGDQILAEHYFEVCASRVKFSAGISSVPNTSKTLSLCLPYFVLTSVLGKESVQLLEMKDCEEYQWRIDINSCGIGNTTNRPSTLVVKTVEDTHAKRICLSIDVNASTIENGHWKNVFKIFKTKDSMREPNADSNRLPFDAAEWEYTFLLPLLEVKIFLTSFRGSPATLKCPIKIQIPRVHLKGSLTARIYWILVFVEDKEDSLIRVWALNCAPLDAPLLCLKCTSLSTRQNHSSDEESSSPSIWCASFLKQRFRGGRRYPQHLHVRNISLILHNTSTLMKLLKVFIDETEQCNTPVLNSTESIGELFTNTTARLQPYEQEECKHSKHWRAAERSQNVDDVEKGKCDNPFIFSIPQSDTTSPLFQHCRCREATDNVDSMDFLHGDESMTVSFKLSFEGVTICSNVIDSVEGGAFQPVNEPPLLIDDRGDDQRVQPWVKIIREETVSSIGHTNAATVIILFSSASGCFITRSSREQSDERIPHVLLHSCLLDVKEIDLFRSKNLSDPFQQVLKFNSPPAGGGSALELSVNWGSNLSRPLIACRVGQFHIQKNSLVTWEILQRFGDIWTSSVSSPSSMTCNLLIFPCTVEVSILQNKVHPVNLTTDFFCLCPSTTEDILQIFTTPGKGRVARCFIDYVKGTSVPWAG